MEIRLVNGLFWMKSANRKSNGLAMLQGFQRYGRFLMENEKKLNENHLTLINKKRIPTNEQ